MKKQRENMFGRDKKISFQGIKGSYHEQACQEFCPNVATVPCRTFHEAMQCVHNGGADYAMIAVDNTSAGRVADVHRLIPESGLHIIGEHFLPIRHALLGVKGASVDNITDVHSHVHAIPQCTRFIQKHGLIQVR